jgi:hypothetical protein
LHFFSEHKSSFFFSIGLELQKRQSAPQNVDVLPTLSITDIDKKVIRVPIIQGQTGISYFSYFSIIFSYP